MSEEIAAAAADLATVARLRTELDDLRARLDQERRATEAAHAKIRQIERAVMAWASAHRVFAMESQCSTCLALLRIAEGTYQE